MLIISHFSAKALFSTSRRSHLPQKRHKLWWPFDKSFQKPVREEKEISRSTKGELLSTWRSCNNTKTHLFISESYYLSHTRSPQVVPDLYQSYGNGSGALLTFILFHYEPAICTKRRAINQKLYELFLIWWNKSKIENFADLTLKIMNFSDTLCSNTATHTA